MHAMYCVEENGLSVNGMLVIVVMSRNEWKFMENMDVVVWPNIVVCVEV